MKNINNKGQGLVELIVAIAVIEIGIFAVWSLFLVNFNAEREAETRIVGVDLAREGIEAIKNIRDSNWLKNGSNFLTMPDAKIWSWDQNLTAGEYAINYDSLIPDSADYADIYLNGDGFYNDAQIGQKTIYRRIVTLQDICCLDSDDNSQCDNTEYSIVGRMQGCELKIGINVVSRVAWQISGRSRQAIVEDNLYNWKQ